MTASAHLVSQVAKFTKLASANLPVDLADLAQLDVKTVSALTGRCVTSIHDMVRAGKFPQPLRDGPRCTRWKAGEVRAWLEAKTAELEGNAQASKSAKERAIKASAAAQAKRASKAQASKADKVGA